MFWPTIFSVLSLIILISLGTWQVKRLIWKEKIIDFYIKQFENKVINLNHINDLTGDIQYRKVKATGIFLNEKEIHITGKTYEGNAGFHVVTPFKMNNGKLVLINRGWVSEKYRNKDTRSFSLINEETYVTGIVRMPQKKGYFVPDNDPENNFWFTIKPVEIKKYLQLNSTDFFNNFYIDALRDGKKIELPIGVKGKLNFRNQHLNYAITWYSLALVLTIIYFSYHFSEGKLLIRKKKDG